MYNPSKKIACQGLCWTGPTIIKEDGAKLTRDIFKLWSDLFNNGPKTLILRGLYTYEFENDPAEDGFEKIKPGSGKYDQITFDREEVREKFDKIVSYADQVIKSDGDLYILHLGI
jgi:hypothetical protein